MDIGVQSYYTYKYNQNGSADRNSSKEKNKKEENSKETETETISVITKKYTETKELYSDSQLAAIKANAELAFNYDLKETMKYIKSTRIKGISPKPVLGELWNLLESTNNISELNLKPELVELQIDENLKNIFAA